MCKEVVRKIITTLAKCKKAVHYLDNLHIRTRTRHKRTPSMLF